MASSQSVLSETLQSITVTKIGELKKQRNAYASSKDKILKSLEDKDESVRKRVSILIKGVKKLPGRRDFNDKDELHNIARWLEQSRFDPSVPEVKLLGFEKLLRSRLDRGSRLLDLAHLYSRLLTEWIGTPTSESPEAEVLDKSDSDESFEVVEDTQKARLQQLRDKFTQVVFEPLETDEVEIDNYLRQLFRGHHGERALERIRAEVSSLGKSMRRDSFRIDDQSLKWCIKALLKNQLLSDEKKASLQDFLKDEAVLSEIKDVLNMRYRDLDTWDWNLGEDGMSVCPRQSLNGKWRVMMDEDTLTALLTHWIGTTWAYRMKAILKQTRWMPGIWQHSARLPDAERAKRKYYFHAYEYESMTDNHNVAQERRKIYGEDFFMSPLPSKFFEEAGGYDDEDENDANSRKSPKDIKQLLLRTLATEVVMRRSLDGEVAIVQSDFTWFATGIAHTTIFAVMRFMGVQEEWITFFKKVLEPPLNMLDGKGVRIRKRGLPMAHVFEKFLGELILFFMDLAVAQHDGMILYRFHDDLWLAGKPAQCSAAWSSMVDFATVMGLEFNKHKTGSVYLTDGKHNRDPKILKSLPEGEVAMNFLVLDPESGSWVINQPHVQEHVKQLQKQLGESKSVLQWIKTWNSCIGRFFSYTFGEPAHCFGQKHVLDTLNVHKDMQHVLFGDTDPPGMATQRIRDMLISRFDIKDVPDSFLRMPEVLGGLGLRNPFIPLLLLRTNVCRDPDAHMQTFHTDERREYENAKREFDALGEKERRKRYKAAFQKDEDGEEEEAKPPITWSEAQTFMSFEDFTKYRECTSTNLWRVSAYFLKQPHEDYLHLTDRVMQALKQTKWMSEDGEGVKEADNETLWTIMSLEEELFEKFGGLEVVDTGLLPLGVLKALRARRVTWQMVL